MKAILILFSFVLCILAYQPQSQDQFISAPSVIANLSDEPMFTRTKLGFASKDSLHSSNVIELSNGDILVSWFAGSREGHTDVGIFTQRLNYSTQNWEDIFEVTNAKRTSEDLNRYIKKVGNAVIYEVDDKHLVMYYVSVSVGGWATSQINIKHSFDAGHSWNKTTRLVTAPFFNISTLVRAHPIHNTNKDIWLPAYYELANTSGLLLKLDKQNNILVSKQIPTASEALAPVLLIQDEFELQVIQRPKPSGKIHSSNIRFENKQLEFQTNALNFTNPNASIDAVALTQNLWLMAYNPLNEKRSQLGLAISLDQGKTWIHKKWIETKLLRTNGRSTEYSYPSLSLKDNGEILLSYTYNRNSIILNQFNLAWLMSENES